MTYATAADVGTWLGGTTPADADRLLSRASDLLDETLLTAVYDTDTAGLPTDSTVAAALRDAACAQVEFWTVGDEEDDILGPVQGVAVAGLQVQYGAGDNRATPMYLAPRAARILRTAGLLTAAVAQ